MTNTTKFSEKLMYKVQNNHILIVYMDEFMFGTAMLAVLFSSASLGC